MVKDFAKHPTDYLFLFAILGLFVFGFLSSWPNRQIQQAFAFSVALAYFFWGLLHHRQSDSLTIRVVLEYFFVSLFAGSVLILLTL